MPALSQAQQKAAGAALAAKLKSSVKSKPLGPAVSTLEPVDAFLHPIQLIKANAAALIPTLFKKSFLSIFFISN